MKSSAAVSIGDLAGEFGLATHVLRHWESVGLLAPARDASGRRRYGQDDRRRVALILLAKRAGFSLEDVATMLSTPEPARRRAVMARRRDELAKQIATAQASLDLVTSALRCDHENLEECPNLRAAMGLHDG